MDSTITKIFIGADESYDVEVGGNFVLDFFILFSEEDIYNVTKFLAEFVGKIGKEEIKYDKTSKNNINKILKCIEKIKYLNLYHKSKIENKKLILEINYKDAIHKLSEYINTNLTAQKINIKIDIIAGDKFQKECIRIIKDNLKAKKQVKVNFVNSKTNALVQLADIFAAINRQGDNYKGIKINNKKNKSL